MIAGTGDPVQQTVTIGVSSYTHILHNRLLNIGLINIVLSNCLKLYIIILGTSACASVNAGCPNKNVPF